MISRDAARAENEGITAGEDHFPDFRMVCDIGQRRLEIVWRQGIGLAGPDRLAAETEAAIDRTGRDSLEQHAVGMAMHDARHGRMRIVADGIGQLFRQHVQFFQRRQEWRAMGSLGSAGSISARSVGETATAYFRATS